MSQALDPDRSCLSITKHCSPEQICAIAPSASLKELSRSCFAVKYGSGHGESKKENQRASTGLQREASRTFLSCNQCRYIRPVWPTRQPMTRSSAKAGKYYHEAQRNAEINTPHLTSAAEQYCAL